MMFCKSCGAELRQGAKFCPKCGTPVTVQQSEPAAQQPNLQQPNRQQNGQRPNRQQTQAPDFPPPRQGEEPAGGYPGEYPQPESPRKKRKKGKIIAIVVVVLVLALAGTGAYLFLTSPAYRSAQALGKGEYGQAVELYNTGVADSAIQRWYADERFSREIDAIAQKADTGELTYDQAAEALAPFFQLDNETLSTLAQESAETLTRLNQGQSTFENAQALMEDGEYVQALEEFDQVPADDPHYEEAQRQKDACKQAYKTDILTKTAEPASLEDYRQFLTMVELALETLPEDGELLQRQTELSSGYTGQVKSEALSAANEAISAGEYTQAFALLEDALAVLPEDADLQALKTSAENGYVAAVQQQVSELTQAGDYDTALSILEDAQATLPGNGTLTELYNSTNAAKPVRLCDIKLSESNDKYQQIVEQVVTEDTLGNIYNPGNLYKIWHTGDDGDAKYYLGGEYTTLRLTLAISDEAPDEKNSSTFTIYGDDNAILYTSGPLDRATAPIVVEVDVSGTQWIHIRAESDEYWENVRLLMINPVLYR